MSISVLARAGLCQHISDGLAMPACSLLGREVIHPARTFRTNAMGGPHRQRGSHRQPKRPPVNNMANPRQAQIPCPQLYPAAPRALSDHQLHPISELPKLRCSTTRIHDKGYGCAHGRGRAGGPRDFFIRSYGQGTKRH